MAAPSSTGSTAPSVTSVWSAPEGVVGHSGQPVRADAIFFKAPPGEIGKIISADSVVYTGKKPGTTPKKLLATAGGVGATFGVVVFLAVFFLFADMTVESSALIGMGAAVAGVLITFTAALVKLPPSCSYVGEAGVARFSKDKKGAMKDEVMRFADATELRSKTVRFYDQFKNVTAVKFDYAWKDASGVARFQVKATLPPAKDDGDIVQIPLQFARAADRAWSNYLMDKAQGELEKQGYIQFSLDDKHWVRVGHGFLECAVGSQQQRCEAAEIKSLSLKDGEFHIVHKDAHWFSSKGKFSFKYGQIANGGLFILAVETLVGKEFE